MTRSLLVVVLAVCAACGRIGFEATSASEARTAALEAELAAPHRRLAEEARARGLQRATRYHALLAALLDKNVTVPSAISDRTVVPRFTFVWPDERVPSCASIRTRSHPKGASAP